MLFHVLCSIWPYSSGLRDLKLILLGECADGNTSLDICTLCPMNTVYSLVLKPWTFLVQTGTQQVLDICLDIFNTGNGADDGVLDQGIK